MLLSRVGAKERPYIHRKCVRARRISARAHHGGSYVYKSARKAGATAYFPAERSCAPRVNKLSRFIPFFHRRSRYIFPVRLPGILRTAHTCPGNREIRPSGVSASPSQPAKYHRPASVRKHSEFSQTEFPFRDARTILKSRR